MRKLFIFGLCLALVMVFGSFEVMAQEELAEVDTLLTTYLARVQDNPVVQLGNKAQMWYVEENMVEGTEYEDLPVISTNAVWRGGVGDDPDWFAHVEDAITDENLEEIYRFDNTIFVLKLDGEQVIDWLEFTAEGNFNQIDPDDDSDQFLVNEEFDDYMHDHFEGIEYQYDVTQPEGERVVYAEYNGEPLDEDMEFLVASNNHRATGGGSVPHAVEENVVLTTETENREAIVDYLNERDGEVPELTLNWSLAPVETEGNVLFETSPRVEEYLEVAPEPVDHIGIVGAFGGFSIVSYDLSVGNLGN